MNSESLRLTDHQKRMKGAIVKIDSKCHPVYLGVNTVGRNKTAVVNIKNLNVSQTQALLILVDDTQHFLTDMNSFNGTYIDNTKLVPFKLYEVGNNAQIKFGDVKATYMKLTSNINTTINMTTSALEMTQNMTQQFYAADTQLMNGDISILDHLNNVSVNNKACNTTSVVSDIHEIETQKVNFQIELLTNNNSESNSEAKQIVMEEDMNIHDAPTQVVVYNPPIQKANENVDDPKECVDKSNELQSDDLPLNNLVIDEGSPSKKVERNTRSSSPGPSISLVHKTFEDSLFDNSKDDSTVPGIEIEETILDSKLEDACMDSNSNESLDFLAIGGEKNSYDEDKENIGIPVKEHSQETDLPRQLNKNNTVKQLSICTSDSVDSSSISARHSSEDTATKTAKIGMTNKPTNLNIEDNGDSDIETTQDLMKPKKKRLMNLLSNSDSESDMDDTQDIGFIKKPVKKLESDEETSINSNIIHSDSDTDCEAELVKTGEILLKKNIDNVPNEISKELSISLVTNVEKNLELNHKKVSELNRHSQSDSDKDKSKSNSQQSIKLFNVNASDSETIKLNDSDCIPATQDAFAEAFNYQPDPGTSSSTEDFRLGLTQIEESINNENSKLDQENTASINSEDVTDKICKENLQNPDDIYYIPTQQVTELPKALSDDDQETEAYLMPTQQILKNKDTTPCSVTTENDLYDLPTQQFSTVKNTPADDIYILPTQPLTIESQFKVPKYFTFKKKTVLDESLSTLLGDNKKDDDIFNAATQKMSASSEAQNISDMFDMATQIVSGPSILDDDNTEKDTENNLYIQSTQRIESSADNIKGLESNSVQLQSLVTENNPKAFYPGPLDVPTQPAILQNHDGVNTQEELELWSTSNAPELDEGRPNNPIAEVLNEGNTNEHSQKNNVGCSRGKPSSSHEQLGDKLGEQLTPLPVIKDVPPADTRPEVEPHSTVYSGDDEEETIETLSQIEAFIKKPIDNMSFKTRISKKVPLNTKCRDSLRRSSTKTKGDIIHETTAETITPKRTSKRKNYVQEEINNTSIKRKPTDKEQLESNSEGECNKDIKSDVDQSFALLESKATKSRKKVIDPVVQDFKVTVTSHRRSMNIAESSMIQTNISRTTRMSSSSKNKCKVAVKNKLKPKNEDSEFSESDISDRDNYKKDAISNVKVVIPNRIRRGTSGSKLLTTSKTVESSDEALPSHTVETTPGKRKRIAQYTDNAKSTSEAGSSEISNDTDFCPTLKRQRNIKEEELSSAERSRRKLKPKVVFTMFDNPQLEGIIRKLGGSIVDSVNSCTVLITEHVKRSQKLLAAVGQGKPICSPQWIKESNKAGEFLDPWDFILTDREAETKWEFSLHESLNRAKNQKLLNDYVFLILTSNATDVLKGAIEASGGKCLLKTPTKKSGAEFIAVASPDQKSKFTKLSKQNPNIKVVEPEAIFDGVLRQEMRLSKHLLI